MNKPESMKIKLTKKWCGLPVGYETTLIKKKAYDLIERGYAEEVGSKPKSRKSPVKNRAIQSSSNE